MIKGGGAGVGVGRTTGKGGSRLEGEAGLLEGTSLDAAAANRPKNQARRPLPARCKQGHPSRPSSPILPQGTWVQSHLTLPPSASASYRIVPYRTASNPSPPFTRLSASMACSSWRSTSHPLHASRVSFVWGRVIFSGGLTPPTPHPPPKQARAPNLPTTRTQKSPIQPHPPPPAASPSFW